MQKKFQTHFPWLNIYSSYETVTNPIYHYFSRDLEGYQPITLHQHHVKMYLEISSTIPVSSSQVDNSTIRDFDYYNCQEPHYDPMIIDQQKMIKDSQWVKKYEPAKFYELLTDEKINREILTWLKAWDPIVFKKSHHQEATKIRTFTKKNRPFEIKNKIILLAGPPGCGKSTLVRVLAKHCKYDIKEINASDDRSANHIIEQISHFATSNSVNVDKPALICLDQIDGVVDNEMNGIKTILDFIENGSKKKQHKQQKQQQTVKLNRPVIFICNDPFARGLRELRKKAHIFYFNELQTDKVVKRLKQICEKEKVYIESEVLLKISNLCLNDIRGSVGLLELICREKRNSLRSPKQIINRMKFSFTRDNQAQINNFISSVMYQSSDKNLTFSSIRHSLQTIDNYSLLTQTMFQNVLHNKVTLREWKKALEFYDIFALQDQLSRIGWKYHNDMNVEHCLPYYFFYISYRNSEQRRIQFPLPFFEQKRKHNTQKDILLQIYKNIPLKIKSCLPKKELVTSYLLALFLGMQASSTKEEEVINSVSKIVYYGFTIRKEDNSPIFSPEIDTLLTFGKRKPETLISGISKMLMIENYGFMKMKKDILGEQQFKETAEKLINELHIQTRKKRKNHCGIQYKFQEGTGTKITYPILIKHFF